MVQHFVDVPLNVHDFDMIVTLAEAPPRADRWRRLACPGPATPRNRRLGRRGDAAAAVGGGG